MSERVDRIGFRGLVVALWLGTAYYLVFGGVYSVFDMQELGTQRNAANVRIDSLIARTDSLIHRGDSLTTMPAAIERVAREKFGLIRDGELLVRFRSPSPDSETLDD
jgi:cell division protein FtsB